MKYRKPEKNGPVRGPKHCVVPCYIISYREDEKVWVGFKWPLVGSGGLLGHGSWSYIGIRSGEFLEQLTYCQLFKLYVPCKVLFRPPDAARYLQYCCTPSVVLVHTTVAPCDGSK